MGKSTMRALVSCLVLLSCTSPAETEQTDAIETTADPGRLALIDSSGDIVVIDPDGSDREEITTDAGDEALYTQPIWSPDASTLAWGQVTPDGFAIGIEQPGTGETTTIPTPNLPYYMSWSPNGRDLGILHNGMGGIDFRMVDVEQGTITTVDQDAPFYFSWSPAGDRVVTHAGADRVETIAPDGDRVRLEPTAPTYLAPQWTTSGVFHVVDDELIIEDENGERAPVANVSGPTMFVSNPQGTKVALQVSGDGSAISVSLAAAPTVLTRSVVVVDVGTGEVEVASDDLALGFFWSPDGESLLVLTITSDGVVPMIWTGQAEPVGYPAYRPPGTMLQDTFPFFPQYAQSVGFWAPNSSAFAYAGEVGGDRGIWIQELDQDTPRRVADGIWLAWSSSRPRSD